MRPRQDSHAQELESPPYTRVSRVLVAVRAQHLGNVGSKCPTSEEVGKAAQALPSVSWASWTPPGSQGHQTSNREAWPRADPTPLRPTAGLLLKSSSPPPHPRPLAPGSSCRSRNSYQIDLSSWGSLDGRVYGGEQRSNALSVRGWGGREPGGRACVCWLAHKI